MLAGVAATESSRIWRCRLMAVCCLAVLAVSVPMTAFAACVVPSAPRAVRLAQIAAGRSGFDVAFVGRVIRRLPAVKRAGSVFTPLDFAVSKSFSDGVGARVQVLVQGGCVGKSCESVEDTVSYTSRPDQLVLADRTRAGTVSASACTDAGQLSSSDLSVLLHASQLPFTGRNFPLPIAVALVFLFSGGSLLRASRRRASN